MLSSKHHGQPEELFHILDEGQKHIPLLFQIEIADNRNNERASKIKHKVLHRVAESLVAHQRCGIVKGTAALKELLRIEPEKTVGDKLYNLLHRSDRQGKAHYPHCNKNRSVSYLIAFQCVE